MTSDFSRCLSLLRQEKGASQRAVAKDLGISQALLSHYENGVREPGLAFVIKACNYYNVSADFLLGRTLSRDGTTIAAEELYDYSTEKDNVLHGSILATLNKKLLVNSIGVLFDLLGKTGKKEAINAAADYLGTAVYKMFRHLYRADGTKNEDFFSVPARQFVAGIPSAERFRLPTTRQPGHCSAASTRAGISSAKCCPSASRVTAQSNPAESARRKPLCKARPLPRLWAWRTRVTSVSASRAAVSSVQPSSTTMM